MKLSDCMFKVAPALITCFITSLSTPAMAQDCSSLESLLGNRDSLSSQCSSAQRKVTSLKSKIRKAKGSTKKRLQKQLKTAQSNSKKTCGRYQTAANEYAALAEQCNWPRSRAELDAVPSNPDARQALADAIFGQTGRYWAKQGVLDFLTFKVSPSCASHIPDTSGYIPSNMTFGVYAITQWFIDRGNQDPEQIEAGATNGDREAGKLNSIPYIDSIAPNFQYTVIADEVDCTNPTQLDLFDRYIDTALLAIQSYQIQSGNGRVNVTLVDTPVINGSAPITKIDSDGHIFIFVPSGVEYASGDLPWNDQIRVDLQQLLPQSNP